MILNSINIKKDSAIINYDEDHLLLIDKALIKKYDLSEDKEFNLNALLSDNEEFSKQLAKEYALTYISYCMRSEYQVYEYLIKKHIQKKAALYAVNLLKSHNYINDKDFAIVFFENMKLSGKSKIYISQKLKQKGIDEAIIEEVLCEYDENSLYQNARKFLQSKNNSLKKYPPKIRQEKLYRSALSQGFSADMVKNITDELLKSDNSDFDDYYIELSKKKIASLQKKNLSEKELRLKAYTYLLPKGTPKEIIDEMLNECKSESLL